MLASTLTTPTSTTPAMTTDGPITADLLELKSQLKSTWASGDYSAVATTLEPSAEKFLRRNPVTFGERVLDVACGSGQLTIPMAFSGADVIGLDLAPNLVAQARAKAKAEGLELRIDEGDAEQLPYDDDRFDVVVSMFGAMFAPRPSRVASELTRVTKPGGKIVMANWTPEGLVGEMFKIVGRYAPPSPLMPSPLMWGQETIARRRFEGEANVKLNRYSVPFHHPYGAADMVELLRTFYGPFLRAFDGLDASGQDALRDELVSLWLSNNTATDGTLRAESEMLEVVVTVA